MSQTDIFSSRMTFGDLVKTTGTHPSFCPQDSDVPEGARILGFLCPKLVTNLLCPWLYIRIWGCYLTNTVRDQVISEGPRSTLDANMTSGNVSIRLTVFLGAQTLESSWPWFKSHFGSKSGCKEWLMNLWVVSGCWHVESLPSCRWTFMHLLDLKSAQSLLKDRKGTYTWLLGRHA